MSRIIKESYILEATDSDVLAAPSRLAAVPRNGILTIEASSTVSDGTSNFGLLTLQLPDGDIPFEDLRIPANGLSTAQAVLHDHTALQIELMVQQGGHVGVAYAETGTVLTLLYFTLAFP